MMLEATGLEPGSTAQYISPTLISKGHLKFKLSSTLLHASCFAK